MRAGESWLVRAIGESLTETGFQEVSELMTPFLEEPKFLWVHVVGARGLRAFDIGGKSDPYVVVKSNRQVYKTGEKEEEEEEEGACCCFRL